ncbi:peptidoglycan DD-metalloendopeptidase family protein [Spirosoma sp. HMF3257]|uniref:M23 family peptidase n=2 Tax=Spirosoma telluris TaxID=2183553 RepID=A0A327NSL2_9BACT|nr:peptidoglycan DD-metalloendopeptidase family protein [Spirosoma telluris]RAI78370.1 M23 family peptidase [Spirosoma telluris]
MIRFLFYTFITVLICTELAAGQSSKPVSSAQPGQSQTGYIQPGTLVDGYFMFPIQPGSANSLSGGMGDLRPNHFHAGLDIRTGGREGLDVHAAADGYVSRIAVFTGGYGNVIFIKHPNGLTTVYGHLKALKDTLGRFLREQQYERKTFEIDLRPQPGQFPVKQGDVVAASGNTGGSGGPHLHFEIRDNKDNLINPLLYNFSEIQDNVPPYFERVALKTMTATSRINGEYQRVSYAPVRRSDGTFTIVQPITASGLVGMEVLAYDKTSGSPYRNGISCLEIRLDGREVFAYNMNSFPNEQTRFMNVHENYEVEQMSGQRYHRGYIADGNILNLYKLPSNAAYRGRLPLLDGQPHEVTLTLYDASDHSTQLTFTILPEPTSATQTQPDSLTIPPPNFRGESLSGEPIATITTDENVLKLTVKNITVSNPPMAKLITGRTVTEQPVSYVRNNQAVYLIDLRHTLPDSVQFGRSVVRTNFKKRIIPGRSEVFVDWNTRLEFSPRTLFDTLHLAMKALPGGGLEINQSTIPLNDYLTIHYTPNYPIAIDTARTKMYWTSGGNESFLGGSWAKGHIEFKTRWLGKFQLMTDINPPRVEILSATPNGITARIRDDLSGIAEFRALVNDEWVLMQYDYKRALLWSDKLNPDESFEDGAEVLIQVKDRSGNIGSDSTIIHVPKAAARRKAATKGKKKRR